jgi:alpha-D-xyloside xylohydrolase
MRFIPYFYAAFNEYDLTGKPPIRPLVMDWPKDVATYNVDDQFMFGPSVMVAPLLTGQTQRSVYLPSGVWHDFWTGQIFQGGCLINVSKPLDQIPLYVKDNVLLPLAKPIEHVDPSTCFELTVQVFGTNPAGCTLYEDDGVSFDFMQGKQNRLDLEWKNGAGTVQRSGGYAGPSRYQVVGWQSADKGSWLISQGRYPQDQ